MLRLRVHTSEQAANSEGHDHRDSTGYKQGVQIVDRIAAMKDLLLEARPIVAEKRCSYRWCLERTGENTDQARGHPELDEGRDPGCAKIDRWLERFEALP